MNILSKSFRLLLYYYASVADTTLMPGLSGRFFLKKRAIFAIRHTISGGMIH
jgi:hypothetical protein